MKPWKTFYVLILGCLTLMSACGLGSPNSTSSPRPTQINPTQTSVAPLASPTQTAAQITAQADCPVAGTARPAVMPSIPPGTHQNIIYLSEQGGVQTAGNHGKLLRYDVTTGSTSTIVAISNPDVTIYSEQMSADGQWILFIENYLSYSLEKLELVRVDGQGRQTLFCTSPNNMSSFDTALWSPDMRRVAFSTSWSNGQVMGIEMLDLTTAQFVHTLVGHYAPAIWLDATRLYVTPEQSNQGTNSDLYLLDTTKGENQPESNLTHITTIDTSCNSPQSNGTQLYTLSCTTVLLNGCRSGYGLQGPSMVNIWPTAGGKATILYNNQAYAITALHTVSAQILLIYVANSVADFSQNGLWKITLHGNTSPQLARLTTEKPTPAGQRCFDGEGSASNWPQIASDGQFYALRTNGSLLTGSLDGGTPKTFVTTSPGHLSLLGITNF